MTENIDGQTRARIQQIDQQITHHENELIKLKKLKEALLSPNTHNPLSQKAKTSFSSNQSEPVTQVQSKITEQELIEYAKKSAEKNSKGGFLGKGKIVEIPIGWQKFLYPYFDVEVKVTRIEKEKRGWFKKEEITKTIKGRMGLDGLTGAIIDVNEKGISYKYAFLIDLNAEEVRLLYWVGSGTFTTAVLRGLGQSDAKSRRIADGLATKGILSRKATRPIEYTTKYPYPYNPEEFVSLMEQHNIMESKSDEKIISPRISHNAIGSYLDKYWNKCDFLSSNIVYYPYYSISYERENHTRSEVIDAITGSRQEHLENFVSMEPINKIS